MTRCFAAAFLAAAILPCPLPAQDAGKPIRVIVATGVGGTADVFMRVLGDEYHKRYGRPFVVENRTGGGMNIGGRACAGGGAGRGGGTPPPTPPPPQHTPPYPL